MYFWNTKKLIDDLRNERLSEQNYKNYYLVSSVFMVIIMFAMRLNPIVDIGPSLINTFQSIVILIVGTNFCFKANGGNQGKQFLNRLICIFLPIGVKFFVAYLLILFFIILGFVISTKFIEPSIIPVLIEPYKNWVNFFISIVIQVVMYWRFCIALKAISRLEN